MAPNFLADTNKADKAILIKQAVKIFVDECMVWLFTLLLLRV